MAVLAHCWLIIEATIIPNGFLKWFCLSFYIHPFFLFVCQIFLWLKLILKCISIVLFYPYKIFSFICLYVFRFFKNCVIYAFSFTRLTNTTTSQAIEDEISSLELVQNFNKSQILTSYSFSSIAPISCKLKAFQFQKSFVFEEENYKLQDDHVSCDVEEESSSCDEYKSMISDDEGDDLSSSCGSTSDDSCKVGSSIPSTKDENVNDEYISSSVCSSINSPEADNNPAMINQYISSLGLSSDSLLEDQEQNEGAKSVCCFNPMAAVERQQQANHSGLDQESDLFYDKYIERMGWFDVLNYDRTCGISKVLKNQTETSSSIESNSEAVDSLVSPYSLWGKTPRKKLLKSIENDFELVYVAQACLSWEALQHQYRKVEALASSTSQKGVFYNNVAGEFQNFQVLLERFMEDERCEGKRVWNYVRERFSLKRLLQVPKVSGFFQQETEKMKKEAINVKEVLKAIERCIEAFWVFVKIDDKRPWWKFRSPLWTCPPVEDPRDLKLFDDLTRKLQKKELWLKDSQGKQRCWFRKVLNPVEGIQRKEMIFSMTDIKLVSRVLQLPVLSTSQLKWCQEKLENIEFEEGKTVRTCTSGPLFPP